MPPAALIRCTSSIGTLELPCMTIGVPGIVFADLFDDVEMQALLAFEFVGAVAGADRGGERIAAGLLDEFDRFVRIRQAGMSFIHLDVFLDAAELAKLGLDADALWRARDRPRVS